MTLDDVRRLRVAVFGAGMGGLTCALSLAHEGFLYIDVYETAPNLGFVGAGIQLAPNMARILDKLGVWKKIESEAVLVKSTSIRQGTTDEELGFVEFDSVKDKYGYAHMVGHRASLAGSLYEGCKAQSAITFHFSTAVSEVNFGGDDRKPSFLATPLVGPAVRVEADIILAADGIKSLTRAAMLKELGSTDHVVDSGQAAYRIMLTREQMKDDPELLELIDADRVTRWIGEKRLLIAYPIDNKRIYNISTAQPDTHFSAAPSAQYTTRGSKTRMLEVFSDFCPKVHKLLSLVPQDEVCEWKLRIHARLPTWVHHSVALVGDACHPTLPHLAQGAAQAIEDGITLAVALSKLPNTDPESVHQALKIYEKVRKTRAETLVDLATANGKLLHLGEGKAREERDALFSKLLRDGKGTVPDKWADKEIQSKIYGFDCILEARRACVELGCCDLSSIVNIQQLHQMPAEDSSVHLEQGTSSDAQKAKRRRLKGSCDSCRSKKSDSSERPGNVCTNCILSGIACTHDLPRQQKVTEVKQAATAHIMILEARIKNFIVKVNKLHPGEDIEQIINAPVREISRSPSISSGVEPSSSTFSSVDLRYPSSPPMDIMTAATSPTAEDEPAASDDDDDLAHVALAEDLKKLSTNATEDRFFGEASTFMLAKHVTDARNMITGQPNAGLDPRKYRRLIYWELRPWEMTYVTSSERPYVFPENDLLNTLVSLYFEKSNTIIPILHRPTFERSLSMGQHHWDPSFGMTVLLVCAIASRYSSDPRVSVANDPSGMSAGWHYFCQVPVHRKKMLYTASTYDLQYYGLASLYLSGTSMPHNSWTVIAIGLRHAFEKGAHRRKGNKQPSVEEELQKRAFWALICLDNLSSSFVGRSGSTPHDAYDVEYPVECDDEFWETEDPDQAFRQPPGRPSYMTAYVHFIKLCEILGFVLRTLYTTKKSRMISGFVGPDWEGKMVAELDSSMNKWKEALPEHLLWNPDRQDITFFHQSANLYTSYYYVQMQIHRPYLTKKSELTLPSLAMCNSAARACSHVLEASIARGARILPHAIIVAYTAGMVITLCMWGGQPMGYLGDNKEGTESLRKCLDYLYHCEKKWHCAGRLSDMLREASDINLYVQPTVNKRRRLSFDTELIFQPAPDSAEPVEVTATGLSSAGSTVIGNRPVPPSTMGSPLQSLMLTDMGFFPGTSISDNNPNLLNTTNFNIHLPQSEPTASIGIPGQSISADPPASDLFAGVWSDTTVPFTSLEQWDTYFAYMGQS
ncbi:FAD-dependent monooxygenase OpS4 [Psilocybe cubensis]|uniref:FAD-dependent monooxygenase OpS4 n=2 Tax=Psilocybe cubensis TaxID=181762 RepID=A0ACB8GT49_PSICU|nr:FAD-dependent monooxygenase OpS4 [Psilocybe cubensis]KAH9478764.1 FAD-dependent monooxygenase OpS4 [Psilocybe cubensis]